MSTSRVSVEPKRTCWAMRSLMCSRLRTSLMYVLLPVLTGRWVSVGDVPKCGAVLLSCLQVMKKAHVARQRLLRLGVFKEVEVLIDTSEGDSLSSVPRPE